MQHQQIVYISILVLAILALAVMFIVRWLDVNRKAQRELDKYLNQSLSSEEIGRFYERYIGHLYESEGYNVIYNGALSGYSDMGRDLIVSAVDEVLIVQTKCWSKSKTIKEKHIFQLYGSMAHYHRTSIRKNRLTKAVFCTTARFTKRAAGVARVLGVELKSLDLDRSYPMIKCKIKNDGTMAYYLPFDPDYDKIKMDLHRDDCFVRTVKEAVQNGFRRAA